MMEIHLLRGRRQSVPPVGAWRVGFCQEAGRSVSLHSGPWCLVAVALRLAFVLSLTPVITVDVYGTYLYDGCIAFWCLQLSRVLLGACY